MQDMEPASDLSAQTKSPALLALLVAGCAELGIVLDERQRNQCDLYYHELASGHERLNLTTITGVGG